MQGWGKKEENKRKGFIFLSFPFDYFISRVSIRSIQARRSGTDPADATAAAAVSRRLRRTHQKDSLNSYQCGGGGILF